MKTVILAATAREGAAYARDAGLRRRDVFIGSSSPWASPRGFDGLRLTEADLVVEFPGFRDGPNAEKIIEVLQRTIRRSRDAGPEWRAIDGRIET